MPQRKLPPKIKIYEALGALADQRVEIAGMFSNEGKCFSASTPGKFYTISYNPDTHVITSNDNGSLHQGYLGYPAIAFLLKIGKLTYNPDLLPFWQAIDRSGIKQQVHKNHEETLRVLLGTFFQQGYKVDELVREGDQIFEQLSSLQLENSS
jgi:hypothetical protein